MPEQPNHGTIYRVNGEPMLYIRTEQRPGVEQPEHLFMRQDRRMAFQVWTAEVPPEAELVVDERGRQEANEARWLLAASEHDNQILLGLLGQACAWLPRERANELRRRYVESRP